MEDIDYKNIYLEYEDIQKIVKDNSRRKWISVDDKLPEIGKPVLVKRDLKIEDFVISTEDIGVLNGTGCYDRWTLLSQNKYILPCTPTLSSNIVTHWKEIRKKDNKESAS